MHLQQVQVVDLSVRLGDDDMLVRDPMEPWRHLNIQFSSMEASRPTLSP